MSDNPIRMTVEMIIARRDRIGRHFVNIWPGERKAIETVAVS